MTIIHAEKNQFCPDEKEKYRSVNITKLVIDLAMPWLQILIGCGIFIFSPSVLTWLIAILVIAGGLHGLSMISHEAAHRLIWQNNSKVNDTIGAYLFAAPVLLPFTLYRQRHLAHHQLVSKENDTKTFYRRSIEGKDFIKKVLLALSRIDYLLQAITALKADDNTKSSIKNVDLTSDKLSIIVMHFILFLCFIAVDPLYLRVPTYYIILWTTPLVTISFLFGKLRSIAEHQPPSTVAGRISTEYYLNTQGPLLRSVEPLMVDRLFLSKINFHAEHNLWPWIPYQNLPKANKKLWQSTTKPRLINGYILVVDKTYFKVFYDMIRDKKHVS
jgi:fatty acid desaturase